MAKTKNLTVYLVAKNNMSKGLRGATKQMGVWARKVGALASRAGLFIGAAMATGIGMSIRSFMKLDSAMTKSLAITSGVSQHMRSELLRTAQTMSKKTLFSADKLAEGYFYLSSAGKTLTQSQILLGDVAKFAQAGQFDLATATTLLVDSQKTLGLSTKNVAKDQRALVRVSDVLAKANTLSNATIQQFAQSLTNGAGPAMKAFNIGLEEGVSVLAAYAQQGIKGAEAGQMFGRMLRLMIPSAVQNRKEWDKLNIQVFDSKGNLREMHQIVRQMTQALGPMSVAQRAAALEALGFQKRMQNAIFPILGTADAIEKYEKALHKAGGTTKEIAKRQLNSVSAQFKLLANNLNVAAAEMFNFENGANSLVEILKNVNSFFQNDASEWINTIKTLWIELKFGIKQSWAVIQAFFHNTFLLGMQMYDSYYVMGKFLVDSVKVVSGSILKWADFVVKTIRSSIQLIKDDFISMYKLAKNPFSASAWKEAVVGNQIDFGKQIKADFLKTAKDAGDLLKVEMKPTNYIKSMKSLSGIYLKYELEKRAAIEKSTAARIKRIAGDPINPFPKEDGKKDLPGGMSPVTEKARLESSIVQAVQKGSVAALKLEHQRISGEEKIQLNTQKTANGVEKTNKLLIGIKEKLAATGVGAPVDAFAT